MGETPGLPGQPLPEGLCCSTFYIPFTGPLYRGKEIDEATFEANAQTIFDEAENRLHAQKAIMNWLVS